MKFSETISNIFSFNLDFHHNIMPQIPTQIIYTGQTNEVTQEK